MSRIGIFVKVADGTRQEFDANGDAQGRTGAAIVVNVYSNLSDRAFDTAKPTLATVGSVSTGSSVNFGRPPPIVTRANYRNSSYSTHIEKIAVDADEQRTLARDRRAEYCNVGLVPAQVRR